MPSSGSASALPSAGDVVSGKYRIERMIAEGGMGVVFLATHMQLDEKVAIKFLRAEFTGPHAGELAGRFLKEARTSAKIKSEHVVRVHDVGSGDSGTPYIVMEYLTGHDLEHVVDKHGVLPIAQAIDYVLQACEALAEAHALGIVHRDLKPANLFLTHRADGSACVKVLDFGISKFKDVSATGSDLGMTKTHAVMGSPRYMSPEQMRSSKDVDARADVWAIGIILYELFAGTVPFDGQSMPQICAAILEETPKALRGLRPEVSPELDAVVTRCLAKKANDRYANIAHLSQALAVYGTAEGRSSADRVARVLRASMADVTADTAPRDFTVPFSSNPALPSSSPSSPGRISADTLDIPIGYATAGAWTGTHPGSAHTKRRRTIAIATLCAIASVAATTAFFLARHHTNAGPTAAAIVRAPDSAQPRPPTTPPVQSSTPAAAVETAASPMTSTSATPTSTAKLTNTTKKSPTPPLHPTTTTHGGTAPVATPAQTAAPDMWGERK